MDNKKAKILVEIAAYNDPEVLNTVKSAIIQADNPDRVFFSICYQSDNIKDYAELKSIGKCKLKYLRGSEARGSCFARFLCQQMIDDEDYIFQVDSHMRFIKHWDTKMIEELLSLNDNKASISFYPPNCTEEMMNLPLDDEIFDKPTSGGIMYTEGFREDDSLFICNNVYPIEENDKRAPARNPFISAGNFFSFSQIHKDIIHDPYMYFYGDEMPMAIRYYTNGWNNYSNNKSYVYHQYERKNQEFPPVNNAMADEMIRYKRLLNIENNNDDLGLFGLGKERSLKEYEMFAGIDFSKKLVYMSAELGDFENEELKTKVSYMKYKKSKESIELLKKEKIEVLIIDYLGDYKDCINSFISNSSKNNNISFLIGTKDKEKLSNEYIEKNNVKEIVYFDENSNYSNFLSTLIPKLDNNYVMIIDSAVRPLKDWDKYICEAIKKCGTKSALTNWVWTVSNEDEIKKIGPYNNVVKVFDYFNNYLPVYKFDDSIKLEDRKDPYLNPFISDGFLFCKSSILKKLKVDPNLKYEEFKYVLSARLWTSGINIYYPKASFFYRLRDESYLNTGENNYNVLTALFGIYNYNSKLLKSDYEYTLGKERPLWAWYDYIGFDYTNDSSYNL